MVPTLSVGTEPVTRSASPMLRLAQPDGGRRSAGCIPTQSVGMITETRNKAQDSIRRC